MVYFEDSISVFNFSRKLELKLFNNNIYFVRDLILFNKSELIRKLNLSNLLSEDLIKGVHSKGLMFIDELSVSEQLKLRELIEQEQNRKQIKYISDIDVYDMGLSSRTTNALARSNLCTLSSIVDLDIYELERIRNFGTLSLKEVVDKIHSYGLLLKNESTKGYNVIVKVRDERLLKSQIQELILENQSLGAVIEYKKLLVERYMLCKKENDKLKEEDRKLNEQLISILLEEMVVSLGDEMVDGNKIKKLT
ncbi:MAG: hypothetical protein J6B89_05190 [Bacilli bacterium]|nr:hypothetical protein [Bacilli bacterium]